MGTYEVSFNKTNDFRVIEITQTYVTHIFFESLEDISGYIHVIIENYQEPISINGYLLILLFGIIGLAIIIKIKRLVKNKKQV